MKVLYLFNKIRGGDSDERKIVAGDSHDNNWYGMLRLRRLGVKADYTEIEQYLPAFFCKFLRKYILNIFWVHILLFPIFFRYDIIFSSTAYGSMFLRALLRIRKPKWVALDFNFKGTIGERKTIRQKLFAFALSRVDGIVAISEQEANDLRIMFPHLRDNIVFIHEGVDTDFFKPELPGQSKEIILSVGRDPGRDFATLVAATKDCGVPVVLATKPEMVSSIELHKDVTVGHFSPSQMKDLYARALVVVVGLKIKPGDHNDSMGTFAVIEAMSMGVPVIVTDNNSIRSYITDGETGFLVPPNDVAKMREKIQYIRTAPDLGRGMGVKARKFVEENSSADRFAAGLYTLFSNILKKQL